jgi:hypothetical protein
MCERYCNHRLGFIRRGDWLAGGHKRFIAMFDGDVFAWHCTETKRYASSFW